MNLPSELFSDIKLQLPGVGEQHFQEASTNTLINLR